MYGVVYNDPRLQQNLNDRGEADLGYQFIGAIFWFGCFFFFMAWLGASSREKRSVALAMLMTTSLPAMTYSFVIPYRLGFTFQDLNGNPLDIAPHFEALMATPLLIHVMGEITKTRQMAFTTAWWNYFVFIFGILATVITTEPMSPLFSWFAMGAYAIALQILDNQFQKAMTGETKSSMSNNSLWLAHKIALAGNHGATLVWGLNRFQVIPFHQFVVIDGIFQWVAKVVFGFFVLMTLGDKEKSE
jgi:hypothetical protein